MTPPTVTLRGFPANMLSWAAGVAGVHESMKDDEWFALYTCDGPRAQCHRTRSGNIICEYQNRKGSTDD